MHRRQGADTEGLAEERLRLLLDVGLNLVSELDLEAVLNRLVDVAREVTGARYAALGVLDEERRELERFLTSGLSEEKRREIGELPRGRGILGELIRDPSPLRLSAIAEHPRSYGFPPGHPVMRTFLGVPVVIRGHAYGNLYLTEKQDGHPFSEEDERSVTVLADWAAIAIDNARLYEDVATRREELERAVRGLEATTAIARAVGAETDLSRVLELIVKRGRALVDARAMAVLLTRGDRLVLAAISGDVDRDAVEIDLAVGDTAVGRVLSSGNPDRLAAGKGMAHLTRLAPGARSAMIVPLTYRAQSSGVLVAIDRLVRGPDFDDEDERLMRAFAASAATMVATAQTVESERLLHSIEAAEQERRRWARELHDETLQGLGALQVALETALQSDHPDAVESAAREAVAHTAGEIDKLQALIAELRPPSLDDLGLRAAVEGLAERTASVEGLAVDLDISLQSDRLAPDVESAIYRLCQEALNNTSKHALAERVQLHLVQNATELCLEVSDDGKGFDLQTRGGTGYGLIGMAERAQLLGGALRVVSEPGAGTSVSVTLPLGGA